MRKKILFLILSECNGGYGGIAEYNRNLLKALNQNGSYSIHVFVRKGDNLKINFENYIHYKPIFNKYLFSLFVIYKALILKPHIVFNGHFFTLPLSSLILKLINSKGISQFHGTEIWDNVLSKKQLNDLQKFKILSVSNYTKNNIKKINNVNSEVIYNTYNSSFKISDQRLKLRREFKIDDSDHVLITVGRLDSRNSGYKGQKYVIKFINTLKKKSNINFKYFIIGKGELEKDLKEMIRKFDLEHDVFLLGYVNENDLIKFYNSSDMFVLLSNGEGFGIVYLEAMACGLPAIGLDIGGVPEVLKYSFTKTISNESELNDAINDLIKNRNFSNSQISKTIENDFGFSVFYKNVNDFFKRV